MRDHMPMLTQAGAKSHLTTYTNAVHTNTSNSRAKQDQTALTPPRVGMLVRLQKARVRVHQNLSLQLERNRPCLNACSQILTKTLLQK